MVTDLTITSLGGGAYRLDWESDLVDPTFYVYRDGVLVTTTQLTSLVVGVGDGESPVYEVLDDAAAAPGAAYPDYALLTWYAGVAVLEYLVEELVAAVWTERTRIPEDGRGYYEWHSRVLDDATTHQFRVTPIGTNGNAGTARSFSVLMVRIPTVPNVSFSYSAGTGAVTVSAA